MLSTYAVLLIFYPRGSTDAIKQVQHYISLLMKDPTRDLNHLLLKQSAHLLMKQSTHSRSHAAPHEPPRVSPVDAFEDSSRTSTAAASLSITVTTTAGVTLAAKAVFKKSASVSSGGSGTVSTSATVSTGARNPSVSSHSQPTGRRRSSSVSSEKKSQPQQSLQSTTLEQRGDNTVTTTSTRLVTTSVVAGTSTFTKYSAPLTTSSAVRRLFTSSSQTAATQATVVVTATQTVSYPPKVGGTLAYSQPANPRNPVALPSTLAAPVRPSIPPYTTVASFGKQSAVYSTVPRISETYNRPAIIEAQPKPVTIAKSCAPVGGTLSYSSIIGSQDIQPPSSVIEQPLQQIMKTPTILQEPATQLTKPKKKSTYSDAVGKKFRVPVSGPAKLGLFSMGSVSQPPVPPPQPPVQQSKLNLAPGSRPLVNDTGVKVECM